MHEATHGAPLDICVQRGKCQMGCTISTLGLRIFRLMHVDPIFLQASTKFSAGSKWSC